MAMDEATLASELEGLEPADTESAAAQTLADAYETYAADAVAGTLPLLPAGLSAGKSAFQLALVGMSAPGVGITAIPAACVAFWAAVALGLTASFAGAVAITPPPHATLATEFAALMPQNVTDSATLEEAAADIAAMMHTNATTNGTVTVAGPTVLDIG